MGVADRKRKVVSHSGFAFHGFIFTAGPDKEDILTPQKLEMVRVGGWASCGRLVCSWWKSTRSDCSQLQSSQWSALGFTDPSFLLWNCLIKCLPSPPMSSGCGLGQDPDLSHPIPYLQAVTSARSLSPLWAAPHLQPCVFPIMWWGLETHWGEPGLHVWGSCGKKLWSVLFWVTPISLVVIWIPWIFCPAAKQRGAS